MKGIYVVETMCDYCEQLIAYATEEEAEKWSKEWSERTKKRSWVTYYEFGQEFCEC